MSHETNALPEWKTLKCAEVLRELGEFGPTVNPALKELKGYIDGKCYYDASDLRELAAACIEAADWLERRAAIAAAGGAS
jgi:hypothetical protein